MRRMDRRTFLGVAAGLAMLAVGERLMSGMRTTLDDTSTAGQVSASIPAASVLTDTPLVSLDSALG